MNQKLFFNHFEEHVEGQSNDGLNLGSLKRSIFPRAPPITDQL